MKSSILILLISGIFLGCHSNSEPASYYEITEGNDKVDQVENQEVRLQIDSKKILISSEDLISSSYVNQSHMVFSVLSEMNDLSFSFSANMKELKPGTYQVFDCKSASECSTEEDDLLQYVVLAPFPSTPMPALNLSRIAYKSNALGLQPLTLTISKVEDKQQEGMPFKTQKVSGSFSGVLAYVEQQKNQQWKIVGDTRKIEGEFSVYCAVR